VKQDGNGLLKTEFSIRSSGCLEAKHGSAAPCLRIFRCRRLGPCTLVMPRLKRMRAGKESRYLPSRSSIARLLERPVVLSASIGGEMSVPSGSTGTLIFIDGIQRVWTLIPPARAHSVLRA